MSKTSHALSVGARGIGNAIRNRAYSISFEVTRSCNARCKHCHLRGAIPDEIRATAEDYAQRCRELKPVVAMVSGGEPLLRKDLDEIIKALKEKGKAVYITLTTNGALFTRQKYDSLRAAGVDLFSLSLDYPDERHDDFRGIPGLFNKIIGLLEEIRHLEDKAITFSCVVQRTNYRDLPRMAELAKKWGVKLNFSTYTWLRTGKKEYLIPEYELDELEGILDILREHKKKHNAVIASEYTFKAMLEYFKSLSVGNCRAGEKFLIVNPDASLSPCGLHIGNYSTQKEIIANFLKNNTCGNCMTSIRANTEKPFRYQIKDALRASRRSQ
jgi:MoaA/NifB/PqqE/SkfB family radical SAM enzyme